MPWPKAALASTGGDWLGKQSCLSTCHPTRFLLRVCHMIQGRTSLGYFYYLKSFYWHASWHIAESSFIYYRACFVRWKPGKGGPQLCSLLFSLLKSALIFWKAALCGWPPHHTGREALVGINGAWGSGDVCTPLTRGHGGSDPEQQSPAGSSFQAGLTDAMKAA